MRVTTEDLKKMKELDIVKLIKNPNTDSISYNRACEYLLKKYDKMFHRHWWTLQRQLGNSYIVNDLKDEYYSCAYEAFFQVIRKIDTTRIYDENFKIMQLLSWYLSNVRSRLIKEALKRSKVKPLNYVNSSDDPDNQTIDSDVESTYWNYEGGYMTEPSYQAEATDREETCNQILMECFGRWSDLEKHIFALLRAGKNKTEIAEALNIKPSRVYVKICKMKKELKEALGVVDSTN